jgi:hypothetical protein
VVERAGDPTALVATACFAIAAMLCFVLIKRPD